MEESINKLISNWSNNKNGKNREEREISEKEVRLRFFLLFQTGFA